MERETPDYQHRTDRQNRHTQPPVTPAAPQYAFSDATGNVTEDQLNQLAAKAGGRDQALNWLKANKAQDIGRGLSTATWGDTNHRPYDSQTQDPRQQAAIAAVDPTYNPQGSSGGGSGGGGGSSSVVQSWAGAPVDPNLQAKKDALWETLKQRASQSLNIDPNDPNIRQQIDPFAAAQERQRRNYMADMAESAGPYANLRGENRLAMERAGQATGMLHSQLVGRELQARRDEIAQALTQQGALLSEDQRLYLQRELAQMDAAIREKLGMGQLDLGFGNLGLQSANQASYWDWIRQGGQVN